MSASSVEMVRMVAGGAGVCVGGCVLCECVCVFCVFCVCVCNTHARTHIRREGQDPLLPNGYGDPQHLPAAPNSRRQVWRGISFHKSACVRVCARVRV